MISGGASWLGVPHDFSRLVFGVVGWDLYLFEGDSTLALNDVNKVRVFPSIESDADTVLACSGSSSTSVDVALCVLRRLDLDHDLNIRDVKASRCDIGSNEDSQLSILELPQSDLSLVLTYVAVHVSHRSFCSQFQALCFSFCLSENNRSPIRTIFAH
jgi:hypothetical protein